MIFLGLIISQVRNQLFISQLHLVHKIPLPFQGVWDETEQ